MKIQLTAVFLLGAPLAATAQTADTLTVDDYAHAEQFLAQNTYPLVSGIPGRANWLADGRAWYRVSTADGAEFVMVDPSAGTREPAFDHDRLAAALGEATGRALRGDDLPFRGFEMSDDGSSITVAVPGDGGGERRSRRGGQRYTCELSSYRCTAAEDEGGREDPPPNSVVSPDGRRAVFIRDYDLWVRDLETGEETALTTDGVEDYGYGTNNAGWTRRETPVVTWSPDSRRIATFRHDGRGVSHMYLVKTKVGEPELDAWRYPLPGDSVIFRIERMVIDVTGPEAPKVVPFDMPPDAHRSMVSDHVACGTGLCDLLWYPDGSHVAFVSSSRDHKHAWARIADAETGAVRTLFEETSETQIGDAGAGENWRVLPASNELIWWSERDNWVHLYLYDLRTGTLKNRITTGDGNVVDIVRVDEDDRTIYFTGQGKEPGRDPYFRHLYRINFDGSGEKLLTPENADHSIDMAPDGEAFIDTYSTADTPPVTVLRDADGQVITPLEKADISRLLATGWNPPTPIKLKARDGETDIYGMMFTPTHMDSTKKYPIVDYIYPGPQSGSVRGRSFSPARSDHQALAELGFVVVAIDGMGTPGRSKAFHDAYYGDMGDNTLPDQVAGIRQLAERYSWIDIDRVGIWGHSGGGFAAAGAMFRYPDFFKVGIAESGNHDNRNYEDDWGERYQGLLVPSDGEGDNYSDEANQNFAANLKGKLLLAHGGMDSNVPPSNTMLVVEKLIEANRSFDLLIIPNAGHGYGSASNYMTRRRWDYFVENLMGATPPENYEIGARRPVT
jgi:dipeptidyl aminopeptidase/acylaminoacyl peptidase